jgi:hypothetical protein
MQRLPESRHLAEAYAYSGEPDRALRTAEEAVAGALRRAPWNAAIRSVRTGKSPLARAAACGGPGQD